MGVEDEKKIGPMKALVNILPGNVRYSWEWRKFHTVSSAMSVRNIC